MATGIVRFYNPAKGFGLIAPDLGGPAIFAHSANLKAGVKTLMARDRVEYDMVEAAEGASAANIQVMRG